MSACLENFAPVPEVRAAAQPKNALRAFSFLVLAFLLLAPGLAQALTVAEIMAPEFGMREDVVRVYDDMVREAGNSPAGEIEKALERKDELVEKTNRPAFTGNEAQHIAIGKDLISICMVGMYLADRHFMQDEKLYDKYVDEFMPGLIYATYLLGASGTKLSDEKRREIGDRIYAPLLNVLAAHGQEAKRPDEMPGHIK